MMSVTRQWEQHKLLARKPGCSPKSDNPEGIARATGFGEEGLGGGVGVGNNGEERGFCLGGGGREGRASLHTAKVSD